MFTEYNLPGGLTIPGNAPSEVVIFTRFRVVLRGRKCLSYKGFPRPGPPPYPLSPLAGEGPGVRVYRNAATVARVLFSTRSLSLCVEVPIGAPL